MLVELKDSVPFDLIEATWSEVLDKISLVEPSLPKSASVELVRSSGPPISVLYALTWKGEGEAPLRSGLKFNICDFLRGLEVPITEFIGDKTLDQLIKQ